MSKLLLIFQELHRDLFTVSDQVSAEALFVQLLKDSGFREAQCSEYLAHESTFRDPLSLNYPRGSFNDPWYAHAPYESGANFLVNLGKAIVPIDLRVTETRVNPSWGAGIIPSIGVNVAGELETGDSTYFLCGAYSNRKEKRILHELQQESLELQKRLSQFSGLQSLSTSINFHQGVEADLLYDSARRLIRESETRRLLSFFEETS